MRWGDSGEEMTEKDYTKAHLLEGKIEDAISEFLTLENFENMKEFFGDIMIEDMLNEEKRKLEEYEEEKKN